MRLFVEYSLIEMGNAPALGDVEIESLRKPVSGFFGHGVAPSPERDKQIISTVKGQVAVHHCRYSHSRRRGQLYAEFFLNVLHKVCKASLQTAFYSLVGVSPDTVCKLVLPVVDTVCHRLMAASDEDSLYSR